MNIQMEQNKVAENVAANPQDNANEFFNDTATTEIYTKTRESPSNPH